MKKMFFTCLVLSAVSLTVNAQNAERTPGNTNPPASLVPPRNTVAANTTADQGKDLTPAQVKTAEQKAEKNAKALQSKLALSKDQYAKVLDAEKTYQKEADRWPVGAIPQGLESNITWERNKKIQSVLDESQAKKYEEMMAAKK